MKFAHAEVRRGRRLSCVLEQEWARTWSRNLKARCDALLDPDECLDFCWYPGRGITGAYEALQPGWTFCDISDFFGSVRAPFVKRSVAKLCHDQDPVLWHTITHHLARIGYDLDNGLPSGSALACGLANCYLATIDRRFVGDAIRFGDNYAVSPGRMPELRKHLLDVGLHTKRRKTFTKSPDHPTSLLHNRAGIPGAPEMVQGATLQWVEGSS